MKLLDLLKENSYKYVNEEYNRLKKTFLEMCVHKSEFDIEKLTIKKEGNFIAHNYHFLIRQYSLALHELRRMNLDKEERLRQIHDLRLIEQSHSEVGHPRTEDGKYPDIEIKRHENEIDTLEMGIANKAYMCEYFEKCRLKLVEMNGGKEPTNEQWQAEEPDYIKWFLEREMLYDFVSRQTGLRIGVLNNVDLLEEQPVINSNYQRTIEKKMDLKKMQQQTEENKKIANRFAKDDKCIE